MTYGTDIVEGDIPAECRRSRTLGARHLMGNRFGRKR